MSKRFDFESFDSNIAAVLKENYSDLRAIGLSPLPPESDTAPQKPDTSHLQCSLGHAVLAGNLRDELHNAHSSQTQINNHIEQTYSWPDPSAA